MRYTDNLNLKKPEQTEFYDVDDFNENADKIDAEMMKRLQVSGGTMTGTIVQEQDVALSRSVDNSSIHITGSRNGNTGACLTLFGKASAQYQGCFALTTEDSNQNYKQLIGKPTGELLWGEDKIITSAGGTVNGSLMLNTLLAPNDKTYMSLYGGTGWQKGSALILGGVENEERKGSFELTARSDISHLTTLYGHADGRLKWNDKNIVRSVNNILASGDGNVDLPVATAENYGLVRVAKPTDVLDTVQDAAITPAVYHDVSDFRHKQTAYSLGDKVECMFNHELFLECTKAGTTSSTPLDTRNVKHGQVLIDGTAQWTVRTHIKSVNGVVAGANGDVPIDMSGYLPLSGGTLTDFLTITKADKKHNPSILFVSNSGKNKHSIYCDETTIGFWDMVRQKVATIQANIMGNSANGLRFCELFSNEIAIGLMNGVELRIGYKYVDKSGSLITFQKPFSSRCFWVMATHFVDNDNPNYIATGNFTNTNFRAYYRGNASAAGLIYFGIGGI